VITQKTTHAPLMAKQAEIALSIIVPVYNVEIYLPRCLDSIVTQQTNAIEVIVVDDASPGNCAEIVDTYLQKGHPIRYIRHDKNKSLMQARITGIQNAQGRFLLHIDGDDALSENVCAEVLRIIADPEVDMIQYHIHAGLSIDTMRPTYHNPPEGAFIGDAIRDIFYQGKLWWPLCGKAFSRDLCIKALPYYPDEDVHLNSNEDMILFAPLLFFTKKCIVTHSCKYYYFNNPTSLTKKNIYADESKWLKITTDMRIARGEVLKFLYSIKAQLHIENMEKIMHANFVWLEQNICKLPDKLYQQRLRELIPIGNPSLSYKTFLNRDFSSLCLAALHTQAERRKHFKHIAIFTNIIGLGGAERVAAILCCYFVEEGYSVYLFTDEPPQSTDYSYPDAVQRIVLPEEQTERHAKILDSITSNNIDVCIMVSHHSRPTLYDLVSCRLAGAYVVAMEHTMFFYPLHAERRDLLPLRQSAYPLSHAITCLSDDIACWWQNAGFKQAVHIPNPLTFDTQDTMLAPHSARQANILFIAKLMEIKGAFHLPHFLYEVRKKVPEATLTILGRNALNEKQNALFEELIDDYALRDSIVMPGHVTNIDEYCNKSMVFVMPSRLEGAPMSLMEAKYHGVPAVAYSMDYLASSSETEGCLCVPKEDVVALAEAAVKLLQDKDYWISMSQAARNSIWKYSRESILEKWKMLFDGLDSGSFSKEIYPEHFDSQRMLQLTMEEFCYSTKRLGKR
jgi:glycosyltransferase involved in cell wall biosynthesis